MSDKRVGKNAAHVLRQHARLFLAYVISHMHNEIEEEREKNEIVTVAFVLDIR